MTKTILIVVGIVIVCGVLFLAVNIYRTEYCNKIARERGSSKLVVPTEQERLQYPVGREASISVYLRENLRCKREQRPFYFF